jgi:hypothetical protein
MTIAIMVITDAPATVGVNTPRLEYLHKTIKSARRHLKGDINYEFIVADCAGNKEFLDAVVEEYDWSNHAVVSNLDKHLGFGGAIRLGWETASALPKEVTHIFHLEGDFTFNKDIDLNEMAACLDAESSLAQLALLRQPWNVQEAQAGGIIKQHPESYYMRKVSEYRGESLQANRTFFYAAHKRFFTTNPCLYKRQIMSYGWPVSSHSEGHFGINLVNAGYHFGFWQDSLDAAPSVTHIGHVRTGGGY